jgi:hypothetical protein
MTLISLFVTLIVVGVLLWLVNTYVPMDAKIKKVLNIAVIVIVCLWLLAAVFPGWMAAANNVSVGKIRQ